MGNPVKRNYDANKRLRLFLDENLKSPSKVADRAKMRRDTFSSILGRRRPIYADEIVQICYAAGCTVEYLLGVNDNQL